MKKLLIAAGAAFALAAPALADRWGGLSSDEPVTLRAEYVWIVSKTVCPSVSTAPSGSAASILDAAKGAYDLTLPEQLLLSNYCLTYLQGRIDGARRARSLS